MMATDLALISPDPNAPAISLVAAALELWPSDSRPTVKAVTPKQLVDQDSVMDTCRAAWVIVDGKAQREQLTELADLIEARQLPAIFTIDGDERSCGTPYCDGITLVPPTTQPAEACQSLRSTWNQAAVIHTLRAESRFLQARHTGLCDQFDKIDEELRLAALLQKEFTPGELPDVHRVEFEVFYRPAGYVSGDIYDVIRLDDDHVGVFIADAVGHGVPAALMTIYIKHALKTIELNRGAPGVCRIIPPGEVLSKLNTVMGQQQAGRMSFPSACYCVINCKTLEVSSARAGSPYPMVLRRDGSMEWIEANGSLLGVFAEKEFETVTTQLNDGDRLVLFSDGFELAFPSDSDPADATPDQRNEVYVQKLMDLANGPLDQAMKRFTETLDCQVGSLNQRDDLTIVCIGTCEESLDTSEAEDESTTQPVAQASAT